MIQISHVWHGDLIVFADSISKHKYVTMNLKITLTDEHGFDKTKIMFYLAFIAIAIKKGKRERERQRERKRKKWS